MYLLIDPEKCTGCRTCETFCSFRWEKAIAPTGSAITVVKWEHEAIHMPVVCGQCERAACMEVCITGALTRNAETGAVVLDAGRCVGCKMCVTACVAGGIAYITRDGVCRKCDLCEGDPLCARICPYGAIESVPDELVAAKKRRAAASRYYRFMKTAADGGER